jgi:uncharacterized protein
MKYFVLFYDFVDDYITRRAQYREEHLGLGRAAHERGELVMAGALSEPADRGLLVFRAPDPSVAEAFARNDPYVKNGLVARWQVRLWNVVFGGAEGAAPGGATPSGTAPSSAQAGGG